MFGIEKDFQKLMEQVYGPLNKDKQPPDTIEIGGVKYKRVEEPPTLSNKLEEWIETLNFAQSKEHKDLLVIEILNIVKEFIPEPYVGMGLPEYSIGFNECIRQIKNNLQLQ
jgi:hypothetical protein